MKIEDKDWYVDINKVRTNYPRIENRELFLAPLPPQLHPEDPEYIDFWSWESKYCIEGYWVEQFGRWRYCPGKLRYGISWGILEHTIEQGGVKKTVNMKPLLCDFMFEYAAMSMKAFGFSGFSKDEKFTCDLRVKAYENDEIPLSSLPDFLKTKSGRAKEYRDAFDYCLDLHSEKLGRPLYGNPCEDVLILGSRGSFKSYYVALCELEYNLIFNGAQVYDEQFVSNQLECVMQVGSSESKKSEDLMAKVIHSQMCKANSIDPDFRKWFAPWGDMGNEDFQPCPFYIRATGNNSVGVKYKTEYKKKISGQYKSIKAGTLIDHLSYSANKKQSATSGVGGRVLFSDIEEVGLVENFIDLLGANQNNTIRGGLKFGVQWAQGTSGDINAIQETRTVYLDPRSYGLIAFKNQFDNQGQDNEIAYFIPNYVTLLDCKDENGNTDYQKAIDKVNKKRIKASSSKDPQVLVNLLMNEPNYPGEMWISSKGYYFPFMELQTRQKQLMAGNLYQSLAKPVKLWWDNSKPSGVGYEIDEQAKPIISWPIPKDQFEWEGAPVIFEFPTPINGVIPSDMYLYVHDTYIQEDLNKGGSLGVTYIYKTDRYIHQTGTGDCIVGVYIAKPAKGLDYYYKTQSQLIQLFGNCPGNLYVEKDRISDCRSYYIYAGKDWLLGLSPQMSMGTGVFERPINDYGIPVGNRVEKLRKIQKTSEWLLKEVSYPDKTGLAIKEVKRNVFRFPCMVGIGQMMDFDIEKGNFDAVSALILLPTAIGELNFRTLNEIRKVGVPSALRRLLDHPAITKKKYNQHVTTKNFR